MKPTLTTINNKLDKILKLLEPEITSKLTDDRPDEYFVLKMKKEYTAEYLFEECKKLFPCNSWIDLSGVKSDRSGDYEIKFRKNIEADDEWRNISANNLPEDTRFITLPERLLMELKYFEKTGQHLDIYNWTLCAGSRVYGGGVPCVSWRGSRLQVDYCHPDDADDGIRARSAV